MKKMSRRKCVAGAAQITAASLMASCAQSSNQRSQNQNSSDEGLALSKSAKGKKKFLIVLTASGGASILDSAMALSRSEVEAAGGNPDAMNCFADEQLVAVNGSPFKAVKVDTTISALGGFAVQTDQSQFIRNYGNDMMLASIEGTSVNHFIAQRRSLTGNDAWKGRTLQEAVAAQYGKDLPIANINLGAGGFGLPGIDETLPAHARQTTVTNSAFWPLGLSGLLGVKTSMQDKALAEARAFRQKFVEGRSNFWKTFKDHRLLRDWQANRELGMNEIEVQKLASKLYWYPKQSNGLKPHADGERLRQIFPNFERDSFDAQAILAYLAITEGVSCSVTLGPDSAASSSEAGISEFYNPPIAYDFSHTDHRGTQAMMWARMFRVADKLIELLKAKEYQNGESYFDHTMIYFATDFGRSRERAGGSEVFSSGHDLNNSLMMISPMANGGTILGGIDPQNGLTYGFDPKSGRPEPGRKMTEKEIYAGLLQIMGIDTDGAKLPDMSAMVKA